MTENTNGTSRASWARAARSTSAAGQRGRTRTEYQTVNLGGRRLRVAQNLAERTNARRGYCPECSGNGCAACAGRGRATGTPGSRTARTSRTAAGSPRDRSAVRKSSKSSRSKRPRRSGLMGLLGFRKRPPLRRRVKSWLGKTFSTASSASRRSGSAARGGQVVAIGQGPGPSWWRCPRCGTAEYSLPDADVATGRAARHVTTAHPSMPFRIDPH